MVLSIISISQEIHNIEDQKKENYRKNEQQNRRSLKKLEIELPYDPAIPLLGIDTKDTRYERDTCTQCSSQHCLS